MHPSFAAPAAPLPPALTAYRTRFPRCRAFPKRPRPRAPTCITPPASSGSQQRLDAKTYPPASLPQTIEHALLQSQQATAAALQAATATPARLRVELPMGRSRRFWYRMSPQTMSFSESATLALHFAQLFRGLRIAVVLGKGVEAAQRVPWVSVMLGLDDAARAEEVVDAQVVVVAAAEAGQQRDVERVVAACARAEAVVLFNCFLDAPLDKGMQGFWPAYVCRAMDKVAVLRHGAGAAWSVFVEIAVFEYEWVGDRVVHGGGGVGDEEWAPTQAAVEAFAMARDAQRKGPNGYFETKYAGCEAGFWPFMTIACEDVTPIDGMVLGQIERKKAEKRAKKISKRPFGFF